MREPMETVYLKIPPALHDIIKERAKRLGLSKAEVIRNVIAYGIAITDPAMVTHADPAITTQPCSECGTERPASELLATYGGQGVCPEHVAQEAQ